MCNDRELCYARPPNFAVYKSLVPHPVSIVCAYNKGCKSRVQSMVYGVLVDHENID